MLGAIQSHVFSADNMLATTVQHRGYYFNLVRGAAKYATLLNMVWYIGLGQRPVFRTQTLLLRVLSLRVHRQDLGGLTLLTV